MNSVNLHHGWLVNDVCFDDLSLLSLVKSARQPETTDGKNVGINTNVCMHAAIPY
jgi:hypothetical protein